MSSSGKNVKKTIFWGESEFNCSYVKCLDPKITKSRLSFNRFWNFLSESIVSYFSWLTTWTSFLFLMILANLACFLLLDHSSSRLHKSKRQGKKSSRPSKTFPYLSTFLNSSQTLTNMHPNISYEILYFTIQIGTIL